MGNKIFDKLLKFITPIFILVLIFIIPFKSQADDYDCKFELTYIESDNDNVDFYVDIKLKAINDISFKTIRFELDGTFISDDEIISTMPGIAYITTLEEYSINYITNYKSIDLEYNAYGQLDLVYLDTGLNDKIELKSNESLNIMKVACKFEKMADLEDEIPDFEGDFNIIIKDANVLSGSNNYLWNYNALNLNSNDIKNGGSSGSGSGSGEPSSTGGQASDSESYDSSKISLNMSLNSNSTNKKIMIDYNIIIPANYKFNQVALDPLMYFNDSGTYEKLRYYSTSSYIKKYSYNKNETLGDLLGINEIGYLYYCDTDGNFDIKEDTTLYLATFILELKDNVNINKLRISFEIDDDTTFIGDEDFEFDTFNFTDLIITFGESSGDNGDDTPSKTTYTVTFNSNGGSTVDNQIITSGNKITKPSNPTRSGYIFKGWYESQDDANSFDFENTIISSNLTLYAKWEENTSSGDSNGSGQPSSTGGQGSDSESYDSSKISLNMSLNSNSTNKKIMIDYNIIIPANYKFNQVALDPLMYFNDSGTYEKLRYYSTSSYIKKYSYNKNETLGDLLGINEIGYLYYCDTDGNFDIKEDTTLYLATFILELKDNVNINKLRISFEIDDDTTFIGDEDFEFDIFNFEDLIITFGESSGSEDNPSLTSYTVTFNSNGGSTVDNQTITSGSKITKPSNPKREGYTFKGWYESLEDLNSFDFENTIISSDLTLYAKWEENTSSGGSSGSGGTSGSGDSNGSGVISNGGQGESSSTYDSSKITLNMSLNSNSTNKKIMIDYEIVIPANYKFNQVALDPLMYFNESSTYEKLRYYSTSSYIKSYSYIKNEELGDLLGINDIGYLYYCDTDGNFDIKEDTTLYLATFILELNDNVDITKLRISFEIDDDTTFIGDEDFEFDTFNFTDLIITFNNTTTTVYNVKYMLDSTTEYTSRQVIKGNKVIKPATPTKEGYTFAGWYESQDDSTSFDFENTIISSNLTLYAKWESISVPKYKVTFKISSVIYDEITTSYIEQEPKASKEGYTFIGWFENQIYTNQITFPYTPSRNITLYAKLEKNGILNKEDDLPSDTPYLMVEDSICSNDGYFTLKYYLYNPTNIILNSISLNVYNDGYCDVYSFESSTLINFILDEVKIGISATKINISNTLIYIGTLTFKVKTTTTYNQKMYIDSSFIITSSSTFDNTKLNSVLTEINSQFKFSITFMVDNEEFDKQYLLKLEENNIPTPEKEGNTFIGWYTNKSCYEAYKCTYPLEVTNDLVLYAKFESDSICSLEYNIVDSQSKILQIELYLINPKGLQINLIDLTFTTSVGSVIGYDFKNTNIFDNYEFENGGILAEFIVKSGYTTDTRIYLGKLLVLNSFNLTSGTIYCNEIYSLIDPKDNKLELKCEEYSFECSSTNDEDLSHDTSISKIKVTLDTDYNYKSYSNNEYTFGYFDSSFDVATINVETTATSSFIRIGKYNNLSALKSLSSDTLSSISHKVNMYDSSQTYIIIVTAQDGTQEEYKVTLLKYTESQSTAEFIYELNNKDTINSYYQNDIIIDLYLYNANYKVGKLDILLAYDTELFNFKELDIKCESYQLSSNITLLDNYLLFTLYSQSGILDSSKYLVCQIHLNLKEDIEHKAYYTQFDGEYLDDTSSVYNPAGKEKNSTSTGCSLSIVEGTSPYLTEFKLYDSDNNLIYEAELDDLLINNNTLEINVANGYTSLYYYLNAHNNTTVKLDSNIVAKENNNYISLSDDELNLIFNMSVYQESQTASITFNIIKEEESELEFIYELRNTDTIDIYYKNDIVIDIYIDKANYYISSIKFNLIYDTNIFELKDEYYSFESIYSLESISNNNGTISVELKSENGYFNLDKYLIGSLSFKLKENLSQEDHDVEFTSNKSEFYNKLNDVQDYTFETLTFTVNSGTSPYLTQFYIEDSNGNVIYSATSQELNINNNTININLKYKYDTIKYFVDAASETIIYLNSNEVSKLTSYSLTLNEEESVTLEFRTSVSINNTEAYITFVITREKEEIKISQVLEVVDGSSFKFITIVFEDDGYGFEIYFEEVNHEQYQDGDMDILSLVMPYLTIEQLLSQFKQYTDYLNGLCYFKVTDVDGYEYEEDEYADNLIKISTGLIIEYYSQDNILLDKITISIPGDVNCDGYVNTADIQAIFNYLNKQNYEDFSYAQLISMNIKFDDVIERLDANTIINYLKETVDPFEDIVIVEYEDDNDELLLNITCEIESNISNLNVENITNQTEEEIITNDNSNNNINYSSYINSTNNVLYFEFDSKEWLYEI